ncbi:MAG: O-antigen ligase family protein, partial [Myxococcota bacterium]|nr:O-antigen ligase family protein [Myxococcota bacterium]
IQLSSRQVSFYLKGLAIGLLTSAVLGLIVTLINPSPSHPLIEPLVSLGSLHQAMQPGQPDRFAAGGFFFHRLKYAHLSLLLLPVLFVLHRRLAYFGLAIVLIALTQSQATWAAVSLVCMSIIFVTFRIWLPRSLSFYLMAILAVVTGLHAFMSDQHGRRAEIIAGSPSLTTRQFMAEQAIEIIVDKPGGLGHGGFKHWSLSNYPTKLNNRQLPRTLPHNLGLSTVVETGFLGWTLMVTLLTYLLGLSLKAFEMKMPAGQEVRLLSLIVGNATIALICLGLLHDPLYHKPVAFGWMLIIALAHRLRSLYSI